MNNTNRDEVNKFNELRQQWWDPKGPLKTLHQINPLRLEFIKTNTDLMGKKVLDMGCGGGIFTEALSEHSGAIIGLDMASDLLKVAQHHADNSLLTNPPSYHLATAETYAKDYPEAFDIITCMEMLEHVPDPASVIHALSTLLKPGGSLFCSTLNRNWTSYWQAILGAEYILKLLPKGTHNYAAFLKPSELVDMAYQAGLRLQAMKGIGYHLLTQRFFLTPNVQVNYLIHFIKL